MSMRFLLLAPLLWTAACTHPPEPPPRGAPLEVINSQTCREHMLISPAPSYPRPALVDGIAGYAIVTYDLDGTGRAKNERVIESQPARVFDETAVKALLATTFRPGAVASGCRYVAHFAFRIR
jgi:TonB family protein